MDVGRRVRLAAAASRSSSVVEIVVLVGGVARASGEGRVGGDAERLEDHAREVAIGDGHVSRAAGITAVVSENEWGKLFTRLTRWAFVATRKRSFEVAVACGVDVPRGGVAVAVNGDVELREEVLAAKDEDVVLAWIARVSAGVDVGLRGADPLLVEDRR